MADRSSRTTPRVDADGVRTIEGSGIRAGVWLLVLAIILVGVALSVFVSPLIRPFSEPATPPVAVAAAPAAQPAPVRRPTPRHAAAVPVPANVVPPPPQQVAAAPPTPASAPEQPDYDVPPPPVSDVVPEPPPNEPSGIAVFPPPGTKPIKPGIIVPDGMELPPGYVRHYQTTDDGRQLPPILMFHPDYQPLDENGEPIPVPEDRVVPPEMAPAGMPVETLQVPDERGEDVGVSARARHDPAR